MTCKMTCGALVRWSTGVQNSRDMAHVQHFQLPCILCLTIECATADAIEKNRTEFLTTAQEMSIFFSIAHEEVATRRARQTDFRLAAVLVRLFICHQRDSDSLTCGLSDFESVCTWGTPEMQLPNRRFLPGRVWRASSRRQIRSTRIARWRCRAVSGRNFPRANPEASGFIPTATMGLNARGQRFDDI